ncbi:unnamed protein product [Prorocentrum cordatum]|nr:unnamed protein product [Polarella glacialis]
MAAGRATPQRGSAGRRCATLTVLSALAAACAGAGGAGRFPRPGRAQVAGQAAVGSPPLPLARALGEALAQVAELKAQVDAGAVVPDFGAKAQAIVDRAMQRSGGASPELEKAVDGALKPLFLRQAALMRQKADASAEIVGNGNAVLLADKQFRAEARGLVRPGGGWNLDLECGHLGASLEAASRQKAAIAEEQARAARLQQATLGVIGKLQGQMEQLQQKVAGARSGGSPWVLSTSYKIPKTPLQIAGRYEQGRANIELNLTPEKDPTSSQASFVEGIGPANLGVSFNLGI